MCCSTTLVGLLSPKAPGPLFLASLVEVGSWLLLQQRTTPDSVFTSLLFSCGPFYVSSERSQQNWVKQQAGDLVLNSCACDTLSLNKIVLWELEGRTSSINTDGTPFKPPFTLETKHFLASGPFTIPDSLSRLPSPNSCHFLPAHGSIRDRGTSLAFLPTKIPSRSQTNMVTHFLVISLVHCVSISRFNFNHLVS